MFIIAQVFGTAGMLAMLASFQTNRKRKLLRLQVLSCFFYIGQYLCLGAFSGCLMNLFAACRNLLYGRFKKVPKHIVALALTGVGLLSFLSYDGPLSLLPCLATLVFTLALISKNLAVVRLADVVSCLFYLVYNANVGAIMGIIATLLELGSSLIAIYRFDLKSLKKALKKSPLFAFRDKN